MKLDSAQMNSPTPEFHPAMLNFSDRATDGTNLYELPEDALEKILTPIPEDEPYKSATG